MEARVRNIQTAFGLSVRACRKRLGLSQEELAAISGLHRTYIGSVERGERNVTLQNIFVLAHSLRTSASDLIIETEKNSEANER